MTNGPPTHALGHLYIILDRTCARVANYALNDSPTVISGSLDESLEQVRGWQRCANGDSEQSSKKTLYHASDAGRSARCYYPEVYKRDQIVDCIYLKDLGLTDRESFLIRSFSAKDMSKFTPSSRKMNVQNVRRRREPVRVKAQDARRRSGPIRRRNC